MLRRFSLPKFGGDAKQDKSTTGDDELDSLLKDSENFIKELKSSIQSNNYSPFKILRWRQPKGVDDKLTNVYKSLYPKIKSVEASLRGKMAEVAEKKVAFQDQARYLKTRLDSCIISNGSRLEGQEEIVIELRNIISKLSIESVSVKSMLVFNTEILRQKIAQDSSRGAGGKSSFVSWSFMVRPLTDAELDADVEHPALADRLRTLRESKERLVEFLSIILESREMYSGNLESCVQTRKRLLESMKRGSAPNTSPIRPSTEEISNSDMTTGISNDIKEGTLEDIFDHSNCHDCSYVHSIAADCSGKLETLSLQSTKTSERLSALVELRERVRDLWESQAGVFPDDSDELDAQEAEIVLDEIVHQGNGENSDESLGSKIS